MRKKVLILGCTGMLGNAVAKYFMQIPTYDVTLTYRNEEVARKEFPNAKKIKFDAVQGDIHNLCVKDYDYVLNCIGIIKPFMGDTPVTAIKINSLFPWQLAKCCEQQGVKLIHITTDCVFSGKTGRYTESSLHDCLDDYGKSKSLGEPANCMVIRTSIIGNEVHKDASLIAWAKSQKGQTVKGYSHHLWNGMTTRQYAHVCDQIIEKGLYQIGLFHLHSNTVNKFQLMNMFNDVFDLNMTVQEYSDDKICDRSLASEKDLINKISIQPLKRQLELIKDA